MKWHSAPTGKDALSTQGRLSQDRKHSGYGGQSKPIFWGKKAKTTKRIMLSVLRLVCVKPTEIQKNASDQEMQPF